MEAVKTADSKLLELVLTLVVVVVVVVVDVVDRVTKREWIKFGGEKMSPS